MEKKWRLTPSKKSLYLIAGIIFVIIINLLGGIYFWRIDLTSEKKYSLSNSTKTLLRELDDYVYFRVYLEGDFPAGFKRLRNATREMLEEFRAYNDYIQYEFIDPQANPDAAQRQALQEEIIRDGLNPTQLNIATSEGRKQQIIFPGAIISYKQQRIPLHLLSSQLGQSPEIVLNNSVQNLEYNISSALRKLTITTKPRIAFIQGHGELSAIHTAAAREALSDYYTIETVTIDGKLNSLAHRTEIDTGNYRITNKYKAIIIAKPELYFDEKDKFIIDQFIMRGGKVIWFIDPVLASMDSLQKSDHTVGVSIEVNLRDQLFKYGVRINNNLVMDLNALPIPIVTGTIGNQPQYSYYPWYFFPLLQQGSDHPIVKNLTPVMGHFASSLDFVESVDVQKTVLLTTSQYSRAASTPVFITLELLKEEPDEELFNQAYLPVAVLLEGSFTSVFKNRIPPEIADNKGIGFLERSEPTAMIVALDGDIIRNQLHLSQKYPLPLGFDQFTRQQFGNKDFLLNAVNYLCDDSGLILVRTREVKLRQLDPMKIKNQQLFWQIFNMLVPIALVIIAGFIFYTIRRLRYARKGLTANAFGKTF